MTTKGKDMLAKALKSRAPRKRSLVSSVAGAYTNATKGLQNVGAGIRTGITKAVNDRVAEQKNFESQMASGNRSNYYGTAGTFKRKRSKSRR